MSLLASPSAYLRSVFCKNDSIVDDFISKSNSNNVFLICPSDPVANDSAEKHSFADVYANATQAGAALSMMAEPGDRVALLLDNGVEFCTCFLGALLCGLVPVPIAPPQYATRWEEYSRRLELILQETTCRAVITQVSNDENSVLGPPRVTVTQLMSAGRARSCRLWHRSDDDTLVIQYSSGSTRRSLGAELSLRAVTENVRAIGIALNVSEEDVILGWVPLYHDMGLAGTFLFSLYWGLPLVLLSPLRVVTRPATWLWAMSRFGATACAAPNSAYALCVSDRRISTAVLDGLDLSLWKHALNGAEMVNSTTMRAFTDRFSRWGFRGSAFRPVYGLAENVVAVCFPGIDRPLTVDVVDRDSVERTGYAAPDERGLGRARAIASVGRPLHGHRVRIVDPSGIEIGERHVGEIQVASACIMKGYFRQPEETNAILKDGWLATGDLGYLASGDLFIVGRKKDVIKRGGATFDAAEINATVGSVPGVRAGCVSTFTTASPTEGSEIITILAETRLDDYDALRTLEEAVFRAVASIFSLRVDVVRFVRPGVLSKTTSGKIQNVDCRRRFTLGEMEMLDSGHKTNSENTP